MSKSGPGNTASPLIDNSPARTKRGHFLSRFHSARHLLVLAACCAAPALFGQTGTYTFYTVGGLGGSGGSEDGSGGSTRAPALFSNPQGVAVDGSGNIYVTDTANYTIRKVTQAGVVTTIAGVAGVSGSTNATGTAALFYYPEGPAVDSSGNLYVADYGNSVIRKITPAGVVTTLAGTAGLLGSVNGTGVAASFVNPRGVAVDSSGNVYVADSGNHLIRKITSAGVVTTLAGTAGTLGYANGTGVAATFNYPSSVAVDSSGNVYVADTYNHAIRKITSAGEVTTYAGLPADAASHGVSGHADGTGSAASFDYPGSVSVDSSGNVYVADQGNNLIRKIAPGGVVTTLAGPVGVTPVPAGRVDGTGTNARFNNPTGVAVDSSGNVIVADYDNQLIRKVTAAGVVTTIAGAGGVQGSLDGTGYVLSPSVFWRPTNLTMDNIGNIYVSDTFNDTIRMISPSDVVTTIAGTAFTSGRADGTGTAATFNGPTGIAVDSSRNVYVADTYSHSIRMITPAGVVTTIAGLTVTTTDNTDPNNPVTTTTAVAGSADGGAGTAAFNFPSGVAVDGAGNIFVADYNNHTIRKITPTVTSGGTTYSVSTFAGVAGTAGSTDGTGSGALFNHPRDLVIDPSTGDLLVADTGNQTIRRITASQVVTTVAGSVGVSGSADGTGNGAKFNGPAGLSVDNAGNIYVADSNNSTIRKVTSGGVVTTLGGLAGSPGNVDGAGSTARFDHPTGVVADSAGNVFVADNNNNTIREGVAPGNTGGPIGGIPTNGNGSGGSGGGTPVTLTGINGSGSFLHPGGLAIDTSGTLYIADTAHHDIKKVSAVGVVTIFAGKENTTGSADGVGTSATFSSPTGLALAAGNTLYVTDTGNATIRRILPDGTVSTLAGSPTARGGLDNTTGTSATFRSPSGIVVTSGGDLLVADSGAATIRRITAAGVVTTEAGTDSMLGDTDATGPAARFNNPTGLAIDTNDNVYIADTYNDTIRMMTSLKVVTTLAGSAGISGSYDGTGSYALFNLPSSLTAVSGSVLYVADTGNNSIRSVSLVTASSGTVRTIAGFAGIAGASDGIGGAALFNQPQAILYDPNSGYLFVADAGNALIRLVYTGSAAVTTPTYYTPSTAPPSTPVNTLSSGGGAIEAWFALALLALGGVRCWPDGNRRRRPASLAS